jgi:hypothetical protein
MMPQSNVLVVAPLRMEREAELRALLASMNIAPGRVNPSNDLVPFEEFPQIHVARFVILDDPTVNDIQKAYGIAPPKYPLCLAFLADFDGDADGFRANIAARARDGLERIFSCCQGFKPGADLAQWMKAHEPPAATIYVNWIGRTVRQIREEDALRLALEDHLQTNAAAFVEKSPRELHTALRSFMETEIRAGRLTVTPPPPTPLGWWLANALHLVGVPLLLMVLAPFMILYLPIFLIQLRMHEKSDPDIRTPVALSYVREAARLEDYDVTNQFTAIGAVKPGLFRRWTASFFLWAMNWTTRHIFNRGQLTRVDTIHFARWVWINEKKRLLFASNYDSSLYTYMDDFINKIGWGLNLVFSNFVSYPSTRWLVLDGAKDEQSYKNNLHRHQLPTEVWYKAYPGLTVFDLKRNTLIRQGIERPELPDGDLRQWAALF